MKKWIALTLALVMMLALCACGGNKDYDRAMGLYTQGNYEEAALLFDSLGNYGDSADMASSARYAQALEAYNREDFTRAQSLFTGLGSYRDSADWALKCEQRLDYDRAMELYQQGDYAAAAEVFAGLGDYQDSADWANRCLQQAGNVVGVYRLTGIWMDGEDYSSYLSTLGYDKATITFRADGTGSLDLDDSPVSFRWDESVIDDGTDKIPYTFSGSTVSFEAGGVQMTFTRVDGTEAPAETPVYTGDGICGTWEGEWEWDGAHITCVMIIRPDGTYERHHTKGGAPSGEDEGEYTFENNVLTTWKADGSSSIQYSYIDGALTNNGHYLYKR